MIVNKPMTKILPEIYEDNNDMPDIYNNNLNDKRKNQPNTFRLKRSQEKKLKKNALTNNFNL